MLNPTRDGQVMSRALFRTSCLSLPDFRQLLNLPRVEFDQCYALLSLRITIGQLAQFGSSEMLARDAADSGVARRFSGGGVEDDLSVQKQRIFADPGDGRAVPLQWRGNWHGGEIPLGLQGDPHRADGIDQQQTA